MPSKLVITRQKSTAAVTAAGTTHAPLIGERFADILSPHLHKNESLPDFDLCVRLMMRALDASTAAMVKADHDHDAELLDDDEPRQARDEAASDLYDLMVQLREGLGGIYGPVAVSAAGFDGSTPTDPVLLSRQAATVVKALPKVKLGTPRFKGAQINLKDEAHRIDTARLALDGHLSTVKREEREAELTQRAKSRTMALCDQHLGASIDVLTGLLRFVGEPELADRVRPVKRAAPESSNSPTGQDSGDGESGKTQQPEPKGTPEVAPEDVAKETAPKAAAGGR